jgi:outer membrane lipoprotein-sorting protein
VGEAKKGSADEVAEKVDAIYKPIKLFRARFKQKYEAKVAGTTKRSDGVVYVKRPEKLSFRYHEPNKNRVVSDGKTLKIYEHDNKQMFEKDVAGTEYPGAFSFIMGKGLRENFKFEFHKTAQWEGGPVLIGRPRVANPGYKVVLFYIDEALLEKGDPGCIRRVLVLDAQSNRNRFDFIHIEQPATIGNKEFEFTAPPGTNIIK